MSTQTQTINKLTFYEIVGRDNTKAVFAQDELQRVHSELGELINRVFGAPVQAVSRRSTKNTRKNSKQEKTTPKTYGVSEKKKLEVFESILKLLDVREGQSLNTLLIRAKKEFGTKSAPNQTKGIREFIEQRPEVIAEEINARTVYKLSPRYAPKPAEQPATSAPQPQAQVATS